MYTFVIFAYIFACIYFACWNKRDALAQAYIYTPQDLHSPERSFTDFFWKTRTEYQIKQRFCLFERESIAAIYKFLSIS